MAFLLAIAALAGCRSGPAVGQVSGKVTFKDKPVTEGRITFYNPKTGYIADDQLGKDGGYAIKTKEGGLIVGDYVVTVTPLMYLDDSQPTKTPPALMEKPAKDIPRRYRGEKTSPLKVTITEGKNEHNFNMTP